MSGADAGTRFPTKFKKKERKENDMKLQTAKKCEIANKILSEMNKNNLTSDKEITITVKLNKSDANIREVVLTQ